MIRKVKTNKYPSGYGYRVDFHRRGQKRVRKIFQTQALAQKILDKLMGDAARREYGLPVESDVTFSDLMEKHLSVMRKRGRDKTNIKRAETVLNRFAQIVGREIPVEKIRRSDLRRYSELRLTADVQPQTINREMNEIKGCLSKATSYYAGLEDWQPPKGAWLEEPTDGRRQTWDEASFQKVIDELMKPQRAREKSAHVTGRIAVGELFLIVRRTGMRPGEVRKLRKSQVDFTNGIIVVTSKKGMSEKRAARTREIPIDDEVADILKRRWLEALGDYLFPGDDPNKPRTAYLAVFKRACRRAGVAYGLGDEDALILYDARRTAENDMLEAGHSVRAVGDIFGHSAETMAKHYHRSTRAQRLRALESTRQSGPRVSTPEAQGSQSSHSSEEERKGKAASGE